MVKSLEIGGESYFKIENYNQACSSWGKAAQLGNTDSSALVKQYCSRKYSHSRKC